MPFLIPLTKKGSSGAYNINFLFKENNIYFSDNHRTALWCWMQHLKKEENVAIFHIDRHYDTLTLNGAYKQNFPGVFELGSYQDCFKLQIKCGNSDTPLIRWDNYLSFLIEDVNLKNNINVIYLATHKDGTYPTNPYEHQISEIEPYNLICELSNAFTNHEAMIINIDLDYFFANEDENYYQLISEELLRKTFKTINDNIKSKKVKCLTVCLSPECCGGWQNAEMLLNIVKQELNIHFTL